MRPINTKSNKLIPTIILSVSLFTLTITTIKVLAEGEVTRSWNFSNSGDYSLSDSSKIEVSSNTTKLKIQNYANDSNTKALYHLDSSSGTSVTDSSSDSNDGTASVASWTTGNLNNGFSFDGLSKKINVPDSTSLSLSQANTLESWFKLNSSYSASSATQDYGILDKGAYQLYFDRTSGKLTYELSDATANSWAQVAGNDIKSSWDLNGKLALHAIEKIGDDIYVGMGNAVSDAEVWKWDGSTWELVGGDDTNSSWADQTYESVFSLAKNGNILYAGLGTTAGDAEVWYCDTSDNCDDWTKIGGDGVNSGWAAGTFEGVYSLVYSSGTLYAGIGNTASDAEVWSWNGSIWNKIGGDSVNSGWGANYEIVGKLVANGSNLYAALGTTAGDAEVWVWNGTLWSKIGGDSLNSSWDATIEQVISMTYANSKLYVGVGTTAGDGDVWEWNGSSWTQIGGDTLNSSWAASTYEGVYSLTNDGTNVYAGLGATAGDNELWKWNGSSWSKIGGDGVNASFSTTQTIIDALYYDIEDSILYTGVTGAGNVPAELWTLEGGTWSTIGGNYINNSWGFTGLQSVETMESFNGNLYVGTGYTLAANALVFEFDGTRWNVVGGQGVKNSWSSRTYEVIYSMESYKGELYVGLGSNANDAEVWKYSGTTWSKVGGDNINNGWNTGYETVQAMATYGGNLYVGLGVSANDAEVWKWDGSLWSKIGGDNLNGGWNTNYEAVYSLVPFNNELYAGLGATAGDSEVWKWNGSSWSKIGGDNLNSSWGSAIEFVDVLAVYDGALYAGLGSSAGDAYVYKWNGSVWSLVGGDDVNSSWTLGTYERVRALSVYNGRLYAGLGITAGESEVWQYNGTIWVKVAGNLLNNSWSSAVESVHSLRAHNGKLYAGLGETAGTDAAIWAFGNNGFLQSTTSSFDTSWHHVAATYDGTNMKLYIDGTLDNSEPVSLSLTDTATNLLIGSTFGGTSNGSSQGFFEGKLDEIRISNVARSSFNSTPYTTDAQTVENSAAVFTEDVSEFLNFNVVEHANGGSITYRLSTDNGDTWKYWNGSSWATSAGTMHANSASVVDTNIPTLPITSSGIKWQAILDGNGSQQVTLNSVEIEAQGDTDNPSPPNALTSLNNSGGDTSLATNNWYTYTSPYFSWSGATDDGAGVAGYYVYFGTDNTATPLTAGTFQIASNFSASGLTSGQTYYLRIQTKDNAQNVSSVYAPFVYKPDTSLPANPSTVTVSPSGYASSNSFTFSWPASGDNMATDVGAGVAGYQYKTGASTGALSEWSSTTTSTSVQIEDAAYQTNANIFYLRTIDNAGNVSSVPLQTNYYFAGEGPSPPRFVTASPSSSTNNSFAFSWDPPEAFTGDEDDLTYCYSINTLPSDSTCTYTSPGATSLSASAYATQVGPNTLYVAAKAGEEVGGAINYGSYASVTFNANTSAPGIPLNLDISDVSIKTTEAWRLALSWTAPTNAGSGVSNYQLYRSTNGTSYTSLASTTGAAYIDTGLLAQVYYYKVRACDSVSNCGAFTTEVSLLPTGKFTESAQLKSDPEVIGVTTKKATVRWSTDRVSDSKIQYGLKSGDYFDEEPSNSSQVTAHEISLSNLKPGTKYFAVAKWTDEDGNTGVSDEFTLSTTPAPIITDPLIKSSGINGVTLQFTVKGASKVKVYYGKTSSFGGSTEVATSFSEATYNTVIEDLEDGIKYFYKINTFDAEGEEYEGNILSFETLPRPRISNVRIQQVRGSAQPSALISWDTNTEVSSIVTYYPTGNASDAKDEINVTLISGTHRILLKGLSPETKYSLVVKGIDKAGNEASSDVQSITTATDTRPPVISNMRVEGSINKSGGETYTAQLVVSWDTDEPATSQVEYGEGTGTTYSQKTQLDANLTTNHIVIITGLNTSKVYHLRAHSKDKASNEADSVDVVTITPKSSSNALDLVITNLSEVFGFIGTIK